MYLDGLRRDLVALSRPSDAAGSDSSPLRNLTRRRIVEIESRQPRPVGRRFGLYAKMFCGLPCQVAKVVGYCANGRMLSPQREVLNPLCLWFLVGTTSPECCQMENHCIDSRLSGICGGNEGV